MMLPAIPVGVAAFGDVDYQCFQQKVQLKCGIRLIDYKSDQMRRRIVTMSEQAGCPSFLHYFAAMERDASVLSGFLDRMTINVTELLRNPERFAELTRTMLPALLALRKGVPLSAWSAGCSYGAEAYTLAMLFHEIAPTVPHRIKGTDIDLAVLAKANTPCFTETDMAQVSLERRRAHFTDLGTGGYLPAAHLRARVRFGPHDLLADTYPPSEYDLILCRNVLIYFTDEAKERIYRGFFRALRPGGVLFVGGTERLSDHRALGFELIQPFFYRKPV
jgi:chemotaxis protein methyltransferase CheR